MPSRSRKTASRARDDATTLLKADHAEVKELFSEFEKAKKAGDDGRKRELVAAACEALAVHAMIEEEIFYPALRGQQGLEDLLDEADVEHSSIKALVAELEDADVDDELYDAKVKVLSEYVQHHVQEEEGEIFPKAKKSDVDLSEVGAQLEQRKAELSTDAGSAPRERSRRPTAGA